MLFYESCDNVSGLHFSNLQCEKKSKELIESE